MKTFKDFVNESVYPKTNAKSTTEYGDHEHQDHRNPFYISGFEAAAKGTKQADNPLRHRPNAALNWSAGHQKYHDMKADGRLKKASRS